MGTTTVTWTVTDVHNNTQTCTQTVQVQDVSLPDAQCQDVTVQVDTTGNGSTSATAINNDSYDTGGIEF